MRDDVDLAPRTASGAGREITGKTLLVALAATLGLMTSSPTIVQAPLGLMVVPVTHAFHIGRGTFGLMSGLSMLIGAALTPLAGRAMDRVGVRRVVLPGILALGAVQILLGVVPLSVPLLAILLLLQGAVSCLVTPLSYSKVLALWFHARRGVVLGVAAAIGIGAGSGMVAALVGGLIAHGGWRTAYIGTGIYVLVAGAIVIAPFLREPKGLAHEADGVPQTELIGFTPQEALRNTAFRLVMLMVVASLGGISIMMGHGPALLAGRGLSFGPTYLVCAAIGSLSGQMLSGALLDRVDSPKVGLGFAIATLVGGVTILHFGTSAAIVLPAAIVMGLGQGAETGLASYYVSRFCGLKAFGSIFGIVMALVTLSAGIFPTIAGFVFDRTGSYDKLIPLIDVLLVIPPIAIFFMPGYRFRAKAVVL